MDQPQRFLFHALFAVVVLWIMFGHVFGFIHAPNNDMYPRIDSGDLLLYYRLDTDMKAQDIAVLKKNNTIYIGRVVAQGGDVVDITDSESLLVNGHAVYENNIFYKTPRLEGFVEYPITLEEGTYFILADQRETGEDSRYYGTVSKEEIMGTVITVIRRTGF
ncbi:MAG: signal peptidase I [Firmicutes bacterium]|nr:signal peptidase I [Bacillota bacterium]